MDDYSVLQHSMQLKLIKKKKARKSGVNESFDNVPHTDQIKEPVKGEDGKPITLPNGEFKYVIKTIRFCPGESSIYADEQSKDSRGTNILIHGGGVYIDESEVNKIEYLRKCNYNKSNENRIPGKTAIFEEYDREAIYKKEMAKDDKIFEAQTIVNNMDIEELKAFILVMAPDPRKVGDLSSKSESEIRHNARYLAKKNPDQFIRGIQSTDLRTKLHIVNAMNAGIITLRKQENAIVWTDSGESVLRAPKGMDVIQYMIETAKNDPDMDEVIDMLKERTKGASSKAQANVAPVKKLDMYDALIETATKHKVIQRTGAWLSFAGEKYQGHTAMKAALKENGMKLFHELFDATENPTAETTSSEEEE